MKTKAIAGLAFESWAALETHLERWRREVADVRWPTTPNSRATARRIERSHLLGG